MSTRSVLTTSTGPFSAHSGSPSVRVRSRQSQRDSRGALDAFNLEEDLIDEAADVLSEVILAIDMKTDGTIGCGACRIPVASVSRP